jgi:tRNA(Ile)-lysidine synthase
MTASLLQRVAACIAEQRLNGRSLCVGYSGGLDSSVLLHLLADLRGDAEFHIPFHLSAVHVHHGLSPQADAWAAHCADVCRALDVPLQTRRVSVNPVGVGLEAAARAARYRVFRELDADALVLAHHRDDQAETVLLQLLRGANLKGLAAMPQRRLLQGAVNPEMILLRPLLEATRVEIAAYAAEHGLNWIDDASNANQTLSRNALRHAALPVLSARFPEAPQALARAAAQFAEAASLLDALAENDAGAAIGNNRLALSVLNALPEPRARNLLRYFLAQAGVEIRRDALHEALRQVLTARPDAQVRVQFGDAILRLHAGYVVIEPRPSNAVHSTSLLWHGETCIELGAAGNLLFQAANGSGMRLTPGQVSIRRRLGGERMRPGAGRPRRTLKNLLREAGIPAWQRDSLPLVYLDDALVWAAGVGGDSDFQATVGEAGWLISWQAPPNRAG